MAGEDRVLAGGAKYIDFQTDPSRYRHWKLAGQDKLGIKQYTEDPKARVTAIRDIMQKLSAPPSTATS